MVTTLIPPCAHRITIGSGHAIGNREIKRLSDLFCFYLGVDGSSNDTDTFFRERCTALLKACKQTTTKGSPMAAIKKNDCERRLQVFRQVDCVPASYL